MNNAATAKMFQNLIGQSPPPGRGGGGGGGNQTDRPVDPKDPASSRVRPRPQAKRLRPEQLRKFMT